MSLYDYKMCNYMNGAMLCLNNVLLLGIFFTSKSTLLNIFIHKSLPPSQFDWIFREKSLY